MSGTGGRTWPGLLAALLAGTSLDAEDTAWAMDQVMSGTATPVQIAGFAIALRAKGETPAEVEGLARAMLAHAVPVDVDRDAVDVVGTGGDGAHTVNISTMAAMIVAGARIRVVKHGNRAASSRCGAADLLEALGVRIELDGESVARCVRTAGIGFCFAPAFHPALRHAATTRSELGVPTFFNALGPLANPGRPRASAVGVSNARLAPVLAGVFAARGADALVFRGEDGLDELTTTAPSRVWVVAAGAVTETSFDPIVVGVPRATVADLRGGDASFNAQVARDVLAGHRSPVRDAVLLNAAAGIVCHEGAVTAEGLAERLAAALSRAAESIDSGAAEALLQRWVTVAAAN